MWRRLGPDAAILWFIGLACAHDCANDVETAPADEEPDWLENEIVAGFRVWQILFLVCAGVATLVVVACCFKRCRIPRTRQEIEANHKRTLICLLFRSYLDRVPVEEVDLVWALEVVREGMEKRKSKKKRKRLGKKKLENENQEKDPNADSEELRDSEEDEEEDEEEQQPKPLTLVDRFKGIFKKKALVEFSDDESNQLSSNQDNYSN